MLLCEIRDVIGSGFQSMVYNSNKNDTVLKVAKINSNNSPLVQFIKLAKKSNNPFYPRIYNFKIIGQYIFIQMEKLFPIQNTKLIKNLETDPIFNQTKKELLKISPHLDLHSNNYMMRNNKQIVIIDPFQPEPEEVFDSEKIENKIILLQVLIQPLQQTIKKLIKNEQIQQLGTLPSNTPNSKFIEIFNKMPKDLQDCLLSIDEKQLKKVRQTVSEIEKTVSQNHPGKELYFYDMINEFTINFYVIAHAYDVTKRLKNL